MSEKVLMKTRVTYFWCKQFITGTNDENKSKICEYQNRYYKVIFIIWECCPKMKFKNSDYLPRTGTNFHFAPEKELNRNNLLKGVNFYRFWGKKSVKQLFQLFSHVKRFIRAGNYLLSYLFYSN